MDQTLGKRIIAHRKRLGLTQDALAEQLGVTAQAVSKWENDLSCPDIATLPKLAAIFGTTTDELLGVENDPPVKNGEVVDSGEEEQDNHHSAKGNFEFHWEGGSRESITFALLVLLVGGLLLAGRILSWDVGFWEILWPSALLIYGLRSLLTRFSVLRVSAALLGGYFLCVNTGLLDFSFKSDLILPVLILVFGISLLVDAISRPRRPRTFINIPDNYNKKSRRNRVEGETFDCAISFCEDVQYIHLPRLSSGKAAVSFGELTVDLSGVESVADNCDLKLSCSFGELTLNVPRKYIVRTRSNNFFSGTNISGKPDADTVGTIYVDTSASFGEIRIRYI